MKYHRLTTFDYKWHVRKLESLKKVNKLLWRIDDLIPDAGWHADEDTIYVNDPSKEVYHTIVKALNLGIGKKEASSQGIKARFRVDGIHVVFSWTLPESCEVIYEEEEIPEDEIIRVRKTVKEVICEKPLMQSVFPDWVEEENGSPE